MNVSNTQYRLYQFFFLLAGLLFFTTFLGSVHLFDWDEVNFAESAREMLVTGNFTQVQINYRPFWEKPPLFFWLQSVSMSIFGINAFAARLPNAIFGVITLLTFLRIGTRKYSLQMGFWWAMAYLGSFLPFMYFKSGIIDPVFNYFIFLGVYYLAETIENPSNRKAILAGIFTGLAVLTKGPVGFLLILLTFLAFWISERFRKIATWQVVVLYALATALVSSAWFAVELWRGGWWFFKMFIEYQIRLFSTPDAGHEQPFFYHFVVVFLGCFPMSVFALWGFRKNPKDESPVFHKKMLFLFWVVMILFSIVKTKIVHYSSMAYFPLSFFAARAITQFVVQNSIPKRFEWFLGVLGGIFALILTALPLFAYYKENFYAYIDDTFAVDCLKTPVKWGGWEFLIGFLYGVAVFWAVWKIKKQVAKASITLFGASTLVITTYLAIVVPLIEQYSQAPAIEFYKMLRRESPNSYVTTVWFKSYAHYFYFQYPRYQNPNFYQKETYQENTEWLLNGNIDKDAYFVVKTDELHRFQQTYPHITMLYQKGGFAFFKREAHEPPRSED
ncbi:ArnT family glycosyltransferase [Raineya orbicola]|uniref:Dolichyl-phosphate-mannose-protein mannosyltransferase n=1 Tax=Raineya orbicola TaxID=2016530 RepID=A0A2N3II18_9BACT|nr:glycosyltransferase family 39 protein [Raineya orbicola]PKQ69931.1 Dolichyl-phosphate-mannose-protein mannosyltransferase [Raineya orbicola]